MAAFTGYKVTCRPKDSGDPPPDDLAVKEVRVDDPNVTFTTFDDLQQDRVTYLVEVVVLNGEKEIDKASTEAAPSGFISYKFQKKCSFVYYEL